MLPRSLPVLLGTRADRGARARPYHHCFEGAGVPFSATAALPDGAVPADSHSLALWSVHFNHPSSLLPTITPLSDAHFMLQRPLALL